MSTVKEELKRLRVLRKNYAPRPDADVRYSKEFISVQTLLKAFNTLNKTKVDDFLYVPIDEGICIAHASGYIKLHVEAV